MNTTLKKLRSVKTLAAGFGCDFSFSGAGVMVALPELAAPLIRHAFESSLDQLGLTYEVGNPYYDVYGITID